jgi:hypothetical protein
MIGVAHISGNRASDSVLPSAQATQTAQFQIDTTQLVGNDVLIGLLSGIPSSGHGFDSLSFTILENGGIVDQQIFPSPAAANAYFTDHLINLGAPAVGGDGSMDLEFDMSMNMSGSGDGYLANLVVGTVPEPGSVAMLGIYAAMLTARCRRRG